jgi:LmbE family N-acetylglucosaminyl deacetylase
MAIARILRRCRRHAQDLADIRVRQAFRARARAVRRLAPLDDLPSQSVLVVTAHPDDEIIAAGALMSRAPKTGVICLTNGAPREERYARHAGFDNWIDYAQTRRREAEAALALLRRNLAVSEALEISDLELAFNIVPVARYLVKSLQAGFSHVVTHPYEGGHADHDAAALIVHAACALVARFGERPPIIVEGPFYNAASGAYLYGEFAPHADAGLVVQFDLSSEEQMLKHRMFACHSTQKDVLPLFGVSNERFRTAPRYHFSARPHQGEVGFNKLTPTITGRIWRAAAWQAIRKLDLLEELA